MVNSKDATPANLPGRVWAFVLVGAALAALLSFFAGGPLKKTFRPPLHPVTVMGTTSMVPTHEDQVAADCKNAALVWAVMGALLGAFLGLAGGTARGPFPALPLKTFLGATVGTLAAVAGAAAFLPVYAYVSNTATEDLSHDLITPLVVHAGAWAILGAGAGTALGLGLGRFDRSFAAALGGLLGGAIGGLVYEVVGALAFPSGGTSEPLATYWGARLLASSTVCLAVALLATASITSTGRPRREPTKDMMG